MYLNFFTFSNDSKIKEGIKIQSNMVETFWTFFFNYGTFECFVSVLEISQMTYQSVAFT